MTKPKQMNVEAQIAKAEAAAAKKEQKRILTILREQIKAAGTLSEKKTLRDAVKAII